MVGRPGTGKTSACKAWAFGEPAARVLWVEGVGDTSTYARLPETVRSNLRKVEVRFREDGTLVSALPSPENDSWWVTIAPDFTTPWLHSVEGQQAYQKAMGVLLQELKKTAREWDRVVFEECKQSPAALEHFFSDAARVPWLPHTDLVVNAQNWSVETVPGWLNCHFFVLGESMTDSMMARLPYPVTSPYPLTAFLKAITVGYRELP